MPIRNGGRTRSFWPRWPLLLILSLGLACNYFRDFDFARGARLTGGNPELGRKKLAEFSCVSCHEIPGVPHALLGNFAPPLLSWSKRSKIAETFPNTPANLEQWIQAPRRLKPQTTMPDMNVSPADSRDIAAYLYSLN